MKFLCEIVMNNDAFIQDPNELSRILRQLANNLERPEWTPHEHQDGSVSIRDINGNTVGQFEVVNDE